MPHALAPGDKNRTTPDAIHCTAKEKDLELVLTGHQGRQDAQKLVLVINSGEPLKHLLFPQVNDSPSSHCCAAAPILRLRQQQPEMRLGGLRTLERLTCKYIVGAAQGNLGEARRDQPGVVLCELCQARI